ncbi:hypothetical protein RKLH11_3952 [Rhodobacteraceae bacterium KLH11]|nr:hypothetical protein RKLH11_3952 [Rhodobacteraceae bacterium KLH11]
MVTTLHARAALKEQYVEVDRQLVALVDGARRAVLRILD